MSEDGAHLGTRVKNLAKIMAYWGLRLLFLARKRLAGRRPDATGEPRTILLIETAFLGDVVSLTPLIRELAARLPRAKLTALVQARNRPILENDPRLDRVEQIESFSPVCLGRVAARLRARRFDAVICVSPGVKNSLLALLSGGDQIMGYLANFSTKPYYYQDHWVDAVGREGRWLYRKDQHIIVRALLAAAPLLGPAELPRPPEIRLDPEREKFILTSLRREGILKDGVINLVVHAGASNQVRRWPMENLVEVLSSLLAEYGDGLNPIVIGIGGEIEICEEVVRRLGGRARLFLDRSLTELCVLLKHSQGFLGGDSGPKFLAGAFSLPSVVIHGPQRPETVGPIHSTAISLYHQLDCNPCPQTACPHQGKCVRAVTRAEVAEALRRVLAACAQARRRPS